MGGDGGWCRTLLVWSFRRSDWTVDESWLCVVLCNGKQKGAMKFLTIGKVGMV